MSKTKKFKIVTRDKRHKFLQELKHRGLTQQTIDAIDITTNNNVIVDIFNTLLREQKKDYHQYLKYSFLLKLYLTELFIHMNNDDQYQKIEDEINSTLNNQKQALKIDDSNNENYAKGLISEFKFSKEEIDKYLSFNKYYQNIANVFATPFDNNQDIYKFAYLLSMYINLDLFFNQYNVPENYHLFSLKLKTQQEMIDVLSVIIPHNYNEIVITLNKWFKKYEKKYINNIYRKIKK